MRRKKQAINEPEIPNGCGEIHVYVCRKSAISVNAKVGVALKVTKWPSVHV